MLGKNRNMPFIWMILIGFECVEAQTIIDIPVRIDKNVTSKGVPISTEWCASVAANVYKDDTLAIVQGTPVAITIERSKARPLGEEGTLSLVFLQTSDIRGRKIKLQNTIYVSGRDRETLSLGLGICLGYFTVVGYLCLLIKGTEAVVCSGTMYYARGYVN
jgi:hypothetical protein